MGRHSQGFLVRLGLKERSHYARAYSRMSATLRTSVGVNGPLGLR